MRSLFKTLTFLLAPGLLVLTVVWSVLEIKSNDSGSYSKFKTTLGNNLLIRTCERKGRLGNHMFQYASLLGIARRNKRTPVWSNHYRDLANTFNIRMMIEDGNPEIKGRDFYTTANEPNYWCYENWTESLPKRDVCIKGYRQSRLYFNNVERELRTHFTFHKVLVDQARSILNNVLNNLPNNYSSSSPTTNVNITRVAIHVRRGDLLIEEHVRRGLNQPDLDYYYRAMNYFNARYSNVVFVLLTDDMPWCKKNIRAANLVYIDGGSAAVDLAVGSLCHHAILTQGSLGLWIAWFANGITIRPKNVPAPGSPAFKLLMSCKTYEQYYSNNSVVL